jgi:Threonyl-tRNA synthetase
MIVCFYYFKVSNLDFPVVENIMKSIVKEKQNFERLELRKEDLLEMFKVNNCWYTEIACVKQI